MSVYTKEALTSLENVRKANSDVSQRRLARNIYGLVHPYNTNQHIDFASVVESTRDLVRSLGYPTEIALQHLIRRIDRNIRNEAAANRFTAPAVRNRKPRARTTYGQSVKTVGRGRRIQG